MFIVFYSVFIFFFFFFFQAEDGIRDSLRDWSSDVCSSDLCIIPYGTQLGEISFCAYNTGIGWRNIIEKMMMNATVAEWYKQHGRHPVYAGNKEVELQIGRASCRERV